METVMRERFSLLAMPSLSYRVSVLSALFFLMLISGTMMLEAQGVITR
jgi:hypothetical protein